MATLGFEPGTSGSLVLHSTTVPWQLLVFTSDNLRYLTLVQRDWWCESIVLDLWISSPNSTTVDHVRDFLFGHLTLVGFEPWTSGCLGPYTLPLYHCAMATSGFHL